MNTTNAVVVVLVRRTIVVPCRVHHMDGDTRPLLIHTPRVSATETDGIAPSVEADGDTVP